MIWKIIAVFPQDIPKMVLILEYGFHLNVVGATNFLKIRNDASMNLVLNGA